MNKRIITKNQKKNGLQQKIIQLCFDANSIHKFTPGLKMIYSISETPLFVILEDVKEVPIIILAKLETY